MSDAPEEWGPWIEHDGKSRPDIFHLVREVEYADGRVILYSVGHRIISKPLTYRGRRYASSWEWYGVGRYVPAIRYRIRKPRGLTILEGLLETLPEKEGEDA